jgi:hypothetical protein
MIYYPGGFTEGHQNLIVDFNAGYTTIPAALEQLCLELVKLKYDQSKIDRNVSQERLGDYSYSAADIRKVSDDILNEAAAFKVIRF